MKTTKVSLIIIIPIITLSILSCASTKGTASTKNNNSNEIITNTGNISEFLRYEGIKQDSVWVLRKDQLDSILAIVYQYFETNKNAESPFIKSNFLNYKKEFGGFYSEGIAYVVVNMVIADESKNNNTFTIIDDGGCWVVMIIINFNNKTILKTKCNGVA
jgi:hypothetical protein